MVYTRDQISRYQNIVEYRGAGGRSTDHREIEQELMKERIHIGMAYAGGRVRQALAEIENDLARRRGERGGFVRRSDNKGRQRKQHQL